MDLDVLLNPENNLLQVLMSAVRAMDNCVRMENPTEKIWEEDIPRVIVSCYRSAKSHPDFDHGEFFFSVFAGILGCLMDILKKDPVKQEIATPTSIHLRNLMTEALQMKGNLGNLKEFIVLASASMISFIGDPECSQEDEETLFAGMILACRSMLKQMNWT